MGNLSESDTCLLIAEADRVLCHLVMFLPVFLHLIYKMKYSCYQHSFAILVYWVVVEKSTARQKEIENHRFQKKKVLLVSLLRLAGLCDQS